MLLALRNQSAHHSSDSLSAIAAEQDESDEAEQLLTSDLDDTEDEAGIRHDDNDIEVCSVLTVILASCDVTLGTSCTHIPKHNELLVTLRCLACLKGKFCVAFQNRL